MRKFTSGQNIYRTVTSGASFGGNSLDLEIGIGTAEQIDVIEVQWPSETSPQTFKNISANQHIEIIEGTEESIIRNVKKSAFVTDHQHANATE